MLMDSSPPHLAPGNQAGAPDSTLPRLAGDLERWGALFIDVAAAKGAPAAEQVLGGLVDWMGNGLIDGWLHLPIPLFERVSDLAEELFETCQVYLGRLKADVPALRSEARALHESRIREVLDRVRALLAAGPESRIPES
jgi:hypothetical protein